MGRGIAQVFLQSGFKVLLIDIEDRILREALQEIKDIYARLAEKGKISSKDKEEYLSGLNVSRDIRNIKGCPLVIEAVKEDIRVKKGLLREIEDVVPPGTIIASNTSSFSIQGLGSVLKKPYRFLGIHFFYPAPVMPLVEVIPGEKTSLEIEDRVISLLKDMGREPVKVKDSPGFIVNRLLLPYLNNAIKLYSQGIASRDDIDKAMKLGTNHPMGPLELADHIGLDICLNILENFYRELKDEASSPARLLREMVSSGKLGKKSGQGFYSYEK